jgi:LPXTG-motif cell wall-anchored protein
VVSTTVPATTIPTTTIPATTVAPTTVAPTTTAAPELQVLVPPTSTTLPAESDFLVLFPDELPNTGPRFNWAFLAIALALLAFGALIGLFNLRSTNGTTRERKQ